MVHINIISSIAVQLVAGAVNKRERASSDCRLLGLMPGPVTTDAEVFYMYVVQ